MKIVLVIIAVPLVLTALCILFNVNYSFSGKHLNIKIKTTKN